MHNRSSDCFQPSICHRFLEITPGPEKLNGGPVQQSDGRVRIGMGYPLGGDLWKPKGIPWEGTHGRGNPWEPKGIPWEWVPDPPWEGNPWEPKGAPWEGTLGAPQWEPLNGNAH